MAHILIADDDEIIASLATSMLMDEGHACGWVTSGEQLFELLACKRPDLILLDQDMPGMTGSQILRRLRSSEKHYDLPVIMFTAISGAEDEMQALHAGAQDYIRKPFEREFLIWHVNKALKMRANTPKHIDLQTALEISSGNWKEPQEPFPRYL